MIDDLIRELQKALDVLKQCERHFSAEAEMNAALHMSDIVRPAPLAASVSTAVAQLEVVVVHYSSPEAVEGLARALEQVASGDLVSRPLRSSEEE